MIQAYSAGSLVSADNNFDELCGLTLRTLDSDGSRRVYRQTFDAWADWCVENDHVAMNMQPGSVLAFLTSHDTAKVTRQRQLSALRKLAAMLYVLQPTEDNRRALEALKMVKAPKGDGGQERQRRAL